MAKKTSIMLSQHGLPVDDVATYPTEPEHLRTFEQASQDMARWKAPALFNPKDPHSHLLIGLLDGTGNDVDKDPVHATKAMCRCRPGSSTSAAFLTGWELSSGLARRDYLPMTSIIKPRAALLPQVQQAPALESYTPEKHERIAAGLTFLSATSSMQRANQRSSAHAA